MDLSNWNKRDLLELRNEMKFQAEKQLNRFNKLKGEDKILQKYRPYQLFLEHSKLSKSGDRALQFSRNDTRNKIYSDIQMLEKMIYSETSTVTGARKVFNKQVKKQARKVKAAQKKRAKLSGKPEIVQKQGEIEKVLGSQQYFDFLHSKEFKQLQKISKKASEEAIEFYVNNVKYGAEKIYKHFQGYLNSEDPFTKKGVFPDNVKESTYFKHKGKK